MTTATGALPYAAEDASASRRRIGAIMAASSGNLVEWYDFYAYAFTALYFKDAFFPGNDETAKLLNTAAIFAIGFLMRPIGGWLFGTIADKYGRKNSMMISFLMMSAIISFAMSAFITSKRAFKASSLRMLGLVPRWIISCSVRLAMGLFTPNLAGQGLL